MREGLNASRNKKQMHYSREGQSTRTFTECCRALELASYRPLVAEVPDAWMKLYRVRRVADLGIWDAFIGPATLGALAVLAILPLLVPAMILWGGFVLLTRIFDRDSKPV